MKKNSYVEKENNVEYFETNIKSSKIPPENIFKYYSLNSNNVDALINGYFFASHSLGLNDVFDSSSYILNSSVVFPLEYFYKFYKLVSKKGVLSKDEKDEIKQIHGRGNKHEMIKLLWDLTASTFGVISMSASDNNNLMWPHYTFEKGFQLEFNTIKIRKSIISKLDINDECVGFFPVNYVKKLKMLDVSHFSNIKIPFLYATNIKNKNWKYEEEWRFLVSRKDMELPKDKVGFDYLKHMHNLNKLVNRYFYYEKKLVKSITLGANFFTTKDFNIYNLSPTCYYVTPKKKFYYNFLDYLFNEFQNKLYISSGQTIPNVDGSFEICRSKKAFKILKKRYNGYIVNR